MAELAQRPDLIHAIAGSIGDENVRAVYKYLHYLAGMQSAPADQLREPYLDFVEHLKFRIALGDFDAAFLSPGRRRYRRGSETPGAARTKRRRARSVDWRIRFAGGRSLAYATPPRRSMQF